MGDPFSSTEKFLDSNQLKELRWDGNFDNDNYFNTFVEKLQHLQVVVLTNVVEVNFSGLQNLPDLQVLQFKNSNKDNNKSGLSLKRSKRLSELTFDKCFGFEELIDEIWQYESLRKISYNAFEDGGPICIHSVHCCELISLILSNFDVDDASFKVL